MFHWFLTNTPTIKQLFLGGPPSLLWAAACLLLAGQLKVKRGWPTGYTRKVFHFLIFGTVAALQQTLGTPAVCLFGAMTSLVVFYAVLRGDGHLLYEAMAREKDAPRRTFYILSSYVATLVGGIAASVLFEEAALYGFLVTGLADAMAEPVGTRWGKHPYRVPAFHGLKMTRTLEGSSAVFVCSVLALSVGMGGFVPMILLIALAVTALEAISPHGWDNLTIQLAASGLAFAWL
jgi:phytol kinase